MGMIQILIVGILFGVIAVGVIAAIKFLGTIFKDEIENGEEWRRLSYKHQKQLEEDLQQHREENIDE